MSKVIWKYPIGIGVNKLQLPVGAEILAVQMQGEQPTLWAMVDPNPSITKTERKVVIYGTGQPIPAGLRKYIGTFQMHEGALIWHVFEEVA